MRRKFLWMVLSLSLVAVLSASAQAKFPNNPDKKQKDDGTRNLTGQVLDPSEAPLEKAVVYLKNKGNLQVRTFITPKDGSYHFSGLSRNVDYEIRAEFEGASSATRTISSFDGRKDVQLFLKIEPKK